MTMWLKLAAATMAAVATPGSATTFLLTSTNVDIATPSPLFTNSTIGGTFTLADSVLAGQSFGPGALLDVHLNFAGITGNYGDIQADIAPGPIQIFGTRSADGNSFSVFDFRFGFPASTSGCSFVCTGQIIINSPVGPNDPSNFVAVDDLEANSLSVINSFTPHFALVAAVPEPATWAMMLVGFGAMGVSLRRRRPARLSQTS